jgi:hypothetical protein
MATAVLGAALMLASPAVAAASWTWPVRGPVLARFAYRVQTPFARGQRRNVDIAAPAGTPVLAACAGRVRFAGSVGTSGRTVSAACGAYVVSYLHLDRIATRRGARLDAGDPIGTIGVTGRRRERRPHLSFGVRRASDRWGYVDPVRLLPRGGAPPPDAAPTARPRRSPPPLGAAPAGEHRPVAVGDREPARGPGAVGVPRPARGPVPLGDRELARAPLLPAGERRRSHEPVSASHPSALPLGSLWVPAGVALALVAIGAPLAGARLRRRRRPAPADPATLARSAASTPKLVRRAA